MKQVNVTTVNSEIFQVVMSIVVKDTTGLYSIFLKDICEILSLDVTSINEYLKYKYSSLRSLAVPHLELPLVNTDVEYFYVESGEKYIISRSDVFCITDSNHDALPYDLLDLIDESSIKTEFNKEFAVVLNMTVFDCFKYAPQFEHKK